MLLICLFVLPFDHCERYILKTNELISLQIGTSGQMAFRGPVTDPLFLYWSDIWSPYNIATKRGEEHLPVKIFDVGKTRMIVLPYGEKTMTIR